MTEQRPDREPPVVMAGSTLSAGSLIRQARKAQGMHIAVLAAAIKVPPNKLEALEADRFDELPDATFTRALAKTICRVLKVDPEPVLERLPAGLSRGLERMEGGINEPFRERSGRYEPREGSMLRSPALWAPLLLVLAAAVLLLMPIDTSRVKQWFESKKASSMAPGLPAGDAPAAASGVVGTVIESTIETLPGPPDVASAPMPSASEAGPAVAQAAASSALVVKASANSWVEVLDGAGQTLIYRSLHAGETVGLDGVPPLKVTIGNASATQLSFRGQPVDLATSTRGNIARLELR